jgi:hypothetical protein
MAIPPDRRQPVSFGVTVGAGAIAGAALMFLLDPGRGAARRALVRDKAAHFVRRSGRFIKAASVDLANRSRGAARRLTPDPGHPAADDVVVAQIKSAIGRFVSHPGAVHVMIDNGAVRLDGPLLVDEMQPVLNAVRRIAGNRPINNGLRMGTPDGPVPGLQGQGAARRRGFRHQLRSPGVRALLGVTASGLALIAASRYMRSASAQKNVYRALPV